MIVDAASEDFQRRRTYYRTFVNGREVPAAIYADTDAGFVRTLAIFYDATDELMEHYPNSDRTSKILAADDTDRQWLPADWELEEVNLHEERFLSRTIRGAVTLKPFQRDEHGEPMEIQ